MDYYRQSQAVSHTGPAPQNYMYQPTSTPSNSGMYYQNMSGYGQQASPYAMQPSVSQGNTMANQTGASGASGNIRRPRGNDATGVMNPGVPRNQCEVPLRMMVDSKFVGAIIGQQGNKIKEITRESKAKCIVDAHKGMRDPQGANAEKVILIDGAPENSSKAVVKILEVIEAEKEKERDRELAGGDSGLGDLEKTGEIELKLRAHNQLVGRLIGKQGATIKKIMAETETVIYVSNLPEAAATAAMLPPMYQEILTDRTITVKGASIAAVSAAEQKISAKLRQSFEYDVSSRMVYGAAAAAAGGPVPMMTMAYDHMAGMRPPQTSSFKHAKVYVPNNMVGAIIGSKGSHIRGIMRTTSTMIRIEGNEKKENEKKESEGGETAAEETAAAAAPAEATSPAAAAAEVEEAAKTEGEEKSGVEGGEGEELEKREEERLVTISGTDNQIYKAQYAIFAKIAEQQQMYLEEVKLRSEVNVPSRLVGRIIGKGGQNVRELQRLTGAHVKIAEENNPENRKEEEPQEGEGSESGASGETTVRVVGNMNATINVQARIASLIADFNRTSFNENRANGSFNSATVNSAAAAAAAPPAASPPAAAE